MGSLLTGLLMLLLAALCWDTGRFYAAPRSYVDDPTQVNLIALMCLISGIALVVHFVLKLFKT